MAAATTSGQDSISLSSIFDAQKLLTRVSWARPNSSQSFWSPADLIEIRKILKEKTRRSLLACLLASIIFVNVSLRLSMDQSTYGGCSAETAFYIRLTSEANVVLRESPGLLQNSPLSHLIFCQLICLHAPFACSPTSQHLICVFSDGVSYFLIFLLVCLKQITHS